MSSAKKGKIRKVSRASIPPEFGEYYEKYPILDLIGQTDLLPLDLFQQSAPNLKVFLKCEWQNPGGSLKDRPVAWMLLSALRRGDLTRDKTILDSSSGNAGIAYALLGAAMGTEVEIVIPGNASSERFARLQAHGARIRKTDPLLGYDEAIRQAHRLQDQNPSKYFLVNQYGNKQNWLSHYHGTAGEILEQTEGKITHFVAGVGTGGSLTGIGRRLKEYDPAIQVIQVVPEHFPGIEGLKPLGEKEDIVPAIFDAAVVDRKIEVSTEEATQFCQLLAKKGVFVGLSTGAYCAAILKIAKEKLEGVLVTLGCDSGERYFSTRLWE